MWATCKNERSRARQVDSLIQKSERLARHPISSFFKYAAITLICNPLQSSSDCFFDSEYAAFQVLSRFCHGFATVLFTNKPGELCGFFLPIIAYLVLSSSVSILWCYHYCLRVGCCNSEKILSAFSLVYAWRSVLLVILCIIR